MKKGILTLTTIVIITAASSITFGQESKKQDDACKNIVEIKDEKKLIQSRLNNDADYNQYKNEMDEKIIQNKNRIEKLKVNTSPHSQKAENDAYDKAIVALTQKNEYLKNKIYDSFMTKTCAWPSFKAEFDEEMDALQLAISNLEKKNKKIVKE